VARERVVLAQRFLCELRMMIASEENGGEHSRVQQSKRETNLCILNIWRSAPFSLGLLAHRSISNPRKGVSRGPWRTALEKSTHPSECR
jgi:hypothetical protein